MQMKKTIKSLYILYKNLKNSYYFTHTKNGVYSWEFRKFLKNLQQNILSTNVELKTIKTQ